VTLQPTEQTERLIKSVDRVRDLAEVFTPAATVRAMLDLLPAEIWAVHPSPTFLEPACGDGNFLVSILERKLGRVALGYARGRLPAGGSSGGVAFHALEALASIYAVDISKDNVVGGPPGHEVGARDRLLDVLRGWLSSEVAVDPSQVMLAARWIVTRNVQVGNMLPPGLGVSESGRDSLPIHGYEWDPETLTVSVTRTTLGAVLASISSESSGVFPLFEPAESARLWAGPALELHQAGSAALTRSTDRKVRTATAGR
jgi:hypothetical protein